MTAPVILSAVGSGFISHSLNLYLAFALGSTCPLALMSSLCSPCHRAHVPTCPLALRRAMCAQPLTANRLHLSYVPDPVCAIPHPGRDAVAPLPDGPAFASLAHMSTCQPAS
jgi:hypothetical protein